VLSGFNIHLPYTSWGVGYGRCFRFLLEVPMARYIPVEVEIYPKYIKLYAQLHDLPPKIVQENQMLNCAALYEHKVRMLRMTVTEARYAFLKQYPSMKVPVKINRMTFKVKRPLNCIVADATEIIIHGYSFKASVLDLIRALDGCRWGNPNLKSFELRRQDERARQQDVQL
jgi:hypothetical protein